MTTDSASFSHSGPTISDKSLKSRPASPRPGWLLSTTPVLLWVYAVYRLGTLWHSNQNYGFGWFVPLLCLMLFWERWKCRPARDAPRPAGGTFILLAVFGLALLPAALFLEVIPGWRFAGWIFAGIIVGITVIGLYFLGGRSWSRHFLFPIFFLLVSVPWPTRFEGPLVEKLSKLNAATSAVASDFLGSPAVRHGVLIETGAGLVGVDEACSGIRSLQASVMVALFLGELFRYGFFRRLFLLGGGVGLAFACNVVRTTYLVRTADLHGLAAVNLRHDEAGLMILGVTLVGLLVLTWCLRPKKSKPGDAAVSAGHVSVTRPPESSVATSSSSAIAYTTPAFVGLMVWILVIEVGIELWFGPAEKQATALAAWTFKFPASSPEFSERVIPEATRAMLRYDEAKSAQWREFTGQPWQVYFLRWLPAGNRYRATEAAGEARGHAPDICLRNAGMILKTNFGAQILDFNGIHLRVGTERFLDRGRIFHVASCYWEPHEAALQSELQSGAGTGRALHTALLAFKNRDRGRFEKRVIKMGVWDMETDEAAKAAFREHLQAAIAK